ncbi:MAG: mandelate racemase, partial [Alphaproteobacteria bacterium]|nr:mandelate racemase [Alphaproteobacteria bacterium]
MAQLSAVAVAVEEIRLYEWPYRLRLPFRFGVITVTQGRQAVARVRVRLADGRSGWGVAAEALGAKWFDKNPALSDAQNLDQLRAALAIAGDLYRAATPRTPFRLWADHYGAQIAEGARRGLPPLVAGYGPAMLDRAIADAACRLLGIPFYAAVRRNLLGIEPHPVAPDLAGFIFEPFLEGLAPGERIHVRHTVGLVDPITAADQDAGTRVGDGLPETLEEVVAGYGHRYYKLKVGGNVAADVDRLVRIADVLDRQPYPYLVSLDGNEQYEDAAAVVGLWRAMAAEPRLGRLLASILYVEQPIKRQNALSAPVAALAAHRPVIIDESDGEIGAFVTAKALGYRGVSSKNCKGFYKSILNLARCRAWNAADGEGRYFMSAEDLTTQAGVSVQQDLALVNLLGLDHVERNGHHFIDGFAGRPDAEANAFLAAHPDLYHRQGGRVRMRIVDGEAAIGSLACVGFAAGALPD